MSNSIISAMHGIAFADTCNAFEKVGLPRFVWLCGAG